MKPTDEECYKLCTEYINQLDMNDMCELLAYYLTKEFKNNEDYFKEIKNYINDSEDIGVKNDI